MSVNTRVRTERTLPEVERLGKSARVVWFSTSRRERSGRWSALSSHIPFFRNRPGARDRHLAFVLAMPDLGRGPKQLAVVLWQAMCLRTWECFPSHAELAERCGKVNVRTVGRWLQSLREAGVFRWKRRQRRPSLYVPNLAVCDRRYSEPSGSAVNDTPYGFGVRKSWRLPSISVAAGMAVSGVQRSFFEADPVGPPLPLPKLSAEALRLALRR